jgi:hypothetical protein
MERLKAAMDRAKVPQAVREKALYLCDAMEGEKTIELTKSINFFKKAFVMQFYYSSVAYLLLEIISNESGINKLFTIKGIKFTFDKFFITILFYSFFYFLNNFYIFSEGKMKLDSIIRKEKIEEN